MISSSKPKIVGGVATFFWGGIRDRDFFVDISVEVQSPLRAFHRLSFGADSWRRYFRGSSDVMIPINTPSLGDDSATTMMMQVEVAGSGESGTDPRRARVA